MDVLFEMPLNKKAQVSLFSTNYESFREKFSFDDFWWKLIKRNEQKEEAPANNVVMFNAQIFLETLYGEAYFLGL